MLQTPPFHGRKGDTLVLVGPVDAPVTHAQVAEAVEACRKLHVSRVDVLGFEFEMGLAPHAQDEAKAKGVSLALRYIRARCSTSARWRRAKWPSTTSPTSKFTLA